MDRTYQIDNLTEVHLDTALVQVWISRGIVDKLGEFALSHLACAVSEDKEKCVDRV